MAIASHIQKFHISKLGLVPSSLDMRGSTVQSSWSLPGNPTTLSITFHPSIVPVFELVIHKATMIHRSECQPSHDSALLAVLIQPCTQPECAHHPSSFHCGDLPWLTMVLMVLVLVLSMVMRRQCKPGSLFPRPRIKEKESLGTRVVAS